MYRHTTLHLRRLKSVIQHAPSRVSKFGFRSSARITREDEMDDRDATSLSVLQRFQAQFLRTQASSTTTTHLTLETHSENSRAKSRAWVTTGGTGGIAQMHTGRASGGQTDMGSPPGVTPVQHPACPVCQGATTVPFAMTRHKYRSLSEDRARGTLVREFLHCMHCDACFVNPVNYISDEEAKRRYAEHENDPQDSRYVKFLGQAINPLLCDLLERFGSLTAQSVSSASGADAPSQPAPAIRFEEKDPESDRAVSKVLSRLSGMDYGCGPGPAVSYHFGERWNANVINYDPTFYPLDLSPYDGALDFVVCTEVLEHVAEPQETASQLLQLVRSPMPRTDGTSLPSGVLCIMTGIFARKEMPRSPFSRPEVDAFLKWAYTRDPTHIVFYQASTLELLFLRAFNRLSSSTMRFSTLSVRIRQDPACKNVFLIDLVPKAQVNESV